MRAFPGSLSFLALLVGCGQHVCLSGDTSCVLQSPCEALTFTCDAGSTQVFVLDASTPAFTGVASLAADGDVVLANDQVIAVIDALDHPHYIAPTGGTLLDLMPRGTRTDALRNVFQASGLLPGEAAVYTDLQVFDEGDVKAVQVTGHLDGHPEYVVATRYEVRPCEPGIRVRTELLNGGSDPQSWLLSDGWYTGGREALPFVPAAGMGFAYPSFGLSTVPDALREVPYAIFGVHPLPATTYATVTCDQPSATGFFSEEVSAIGVGPTVFQPGDWRIHERFLGVASGPSVSAGVDVALEVRRQLFEEAFTTLRGSVTAPVGPSMVTTGLRAAVLISEGSPSTPVEERIPVTHVLPDENGAFEVRVPTDRDYVLSIESYGQQVLEVDASVAQSAVDVGTLTVPAVGELTLNALVDGVEDHVLVLVVPSDDITRDQVTGRMFGRFESCAPLLGHPHADSPACNRVLVSGLTTVSLPPGTYDLVAAVGPFSTLARVTDVVVGAGEGASVTLDLQRLDLQPAGTLSGDFHVHGGPSFDSSINDLDRARAFLASGIQVIASTEHDVVFDYQAALDALQADGRLALMHGTESTGHILFNYIPTDTNPAVVGHWNFWPVRYDPRGPWRGAAWDEKAEPGLLMQRMRDQADWDPDAGVAQLNHPLSGLQLGRAFGWADSLNLDGNAPLKTDDDGTGQALFLHRPPDDDGGTADFSNADYHAQEVMNGTSNGDYLKYRAFWFYLLDQGIFKAATGNSDSHSLTENVLGTPRTIVRTPTTLVGFQPQVFNAAVREGRSFLTNGPVLEIRTTDAAGAIREPSVDVFTPDPAGSLQVRVAAAPWMPVQEVRIFVNHELVRTLPVTDPDPTSVDPADFERLDVTVPLAELLPGGSDAWIVVEAGPAHLQAGDLDCNGFPDTTDNNADGVVDWRDVAELTEDPGEPCFPDVGPLLPRTPPTDRSDPLTWFAQVFPGGYPLAVSNPLILDVDGGGFTGVLQ